MSLIVPTACNSVEMFLKAVSRIDSESIVADALLPLAGFYPDTIRFFAILL